METGHQLPMFRSLTEEILLFGAPKSLIVLNTAVAAIFILSFHFFFILILNLALHILAVSLSKKDGQIFDCLLMYIRQKNYYGT